MLISLLNSISMVWFQNFLFMYLLGTAYSSLSSRNSQDSHQPLDIFFYEVPPRKDTLTLPLQTAVKNMTCPELSVDESCFLITSDVSRVIKFQYQSLECDNCSLIDHSLQPQESHPIVFKLASLGTVWQISDEDNKQLCSYNEGYLGENAIYHLYVNETHCSMITKQEPEFVYTPILIAIGAYTVLALLWMIWVYFKRTQFFNHLFQKDSLDVSTDLAAAYSSSTTIEEKKAKASSQRLRSLDTVRGFIWMMGMSMALSMRSLLRKVVSRKKIFFKIVKRSLILFALGIMLNTICTVTKLENLRIFGVLQRFGVCYFVVATVHLFYASADDKMNSGSALRDITHYSGEWLIMSTFLALHLLLSFLVHDPDCPRGYFGPGGLHDRGAYENCTGGAAGYIDRIFLGLSHLYQSPSPQGSIAAVLCLVSKDDGWIPVNKNLWSVSFIMATGSLAFILLSICFFICDVQKWWSGAPFYFAGMNSIVLYIGHEMTHNMFPFRWYVPSTHMYLLFMNLWGTTLWVIIAVWMHYKNIFISV
ncbi:heparan-alpha-glucosaminide N-acetyltransferase isoform X11 [Parasteatoda tepidariorum]|uniref:heparan-alpha-glucosaminide N-acetyltransferase isoform X11 n=1 Tax=Parasteatoda tepidariorum TaxID=114398 RepID=UPI0039BD1F08